MVGREDTLKYLSTLNEDEMKEFLYYCMDDLCGRKGSALVNFQSRLPYTPIELKEVVTNVNALCYECLVLDMDHNKLKEKCPVFSQSQCSTLLSCILARKTEIASYVNFKKLSNTDSLLSDYDWKLKWIIGSSAFSAMHEPLLALDLHLESASGNTTMSLELDKTEMKLLIEALEKAQQSMLCRLSSV